jgi:type IV secretory pathway TrbF-like protein
VSDVNCCETAETEFVKAVRCWDSRAGAVADTVAGRSMRSLAFLYNAAMVSAC